MLRRLVIRNFAIIEELALDLDAGLSVLTGETGAGKSILIGALNLVLGGRAAPELIRTGCESAEVTAIFEPEPDHPVHLLMETLGLEACDELLLRRQVVRQGRNRAWLNDHPVTVSALGKIAESLVDISSQHQHQSLLNIENHLLLVDEAGGLTGEREKVRKAYADLLALVARRRKLAAAAAQRLERKDFLAFQLEELEKASVEPGEEVRLKEQRNILRNAETIREAFGAANALLDGEHPLVDACGRAERELERAARYIEGASELAERLESARLELEDIAFAVGKLARSIDADSALLEETEQRLALLQRLLRKHGPTSGELLEKMKSMRQELDDMEDVDGNLDRLDDEIEKSRSSVLNIAERLSAGRKDVGSKLARLIERQLADLGMDKTSFRVDVGPKAKQSEEDIAEGQHVIGPDGIDKIEFLLSPNPGEQLRPLARIASGGELSRVMLAIKSVLLASDPVALSVFDEVDAGIGGGVGQKLGAKISELAMERQVICITHLPQIAAFADHHFLVSKRSDEGRTYSMVDRLLDQPFRVAEIARLMAGEAAGTASNKAARELIAHAARQREAAASSKKKHLHTG